MIQELGSDLVPVFAIGCGFAFVVVWVIAATIDSLYKTSRESRLKEQMVERGYSAIEIDRVVKSGTVDAQMLAENPPAPPVKTTNGFQPGHRVS